MKLRSFFGGRGLDICWENCILPPFPLIRLACGQPPSPARGEGLSLRLSRLLCSLVSASVGAFPLMGEGGTRSVTDEGEATGPLCIPRGRRPLLLCGLLPFPLIRLAFGQPPSPARGEGLSLRLSRLLCRQVSASVRSLPPSGGRWHAKRDG